MVRANVNPLSIEVTTRDGKAVQRLAMTESTGSGGGHGALTFSLGSGPLLGLGEGGPQFDRKGSIDRDAKRSGRLSAAHARWPRADSVAASAPTAGACLSIVRSDRFDLTGTAADH